MNEIINCKRLCAPLEADPLYDASFSIEESQCVAFLGLNGSGLETLLDILSGICPQYEGSVVINGKAVSMNRVADAQGNGIFCIGRNRLLFKNLTIAENIGLLNHTSHKTFFVNHRDAIKRTNEYLEKYDINVLSKNTPDQLTLYEFHEVEILKAINCGAKLIAFSDFLASYTMAQRTLFLTRILQLKTLGISTIIVLHQIREEWIDIFDKIVLLHEGVTGLTFSTKDSTFQKSHIMDFLQGENNYRVGEARKISNRDKNKQVLGWIEHEGKEVLNLRPGYILGILDEDRKLPQTSGNLAEYINLNFSIYIHDKKVTPIPDCLWKSRIALIYYKYGVTPIFKNLSVIDNICFYAQHYYGHFGVINRRINKYLAVQIIKSSEYLLELLPLINLRDCSKLTERLLIKLSVARWMAIRPEVCIFFLPFRYSDAIDIEEQKQFIREQIKKGESAFIIISEEQLFLNDDIVSKVIKV